MSQQIDGIIEDISNNIELLKDAEQIDLLDCKHLLTILFEVQKDLFEKFQDVFKTMKEVKEIEKATKKEEKNKEKPENVDVKRLYL